MVDLSKFNNEKFHRGASAGKELTWRMIQQGFYNLEWIKAYGLKRRILMALGAELAAGVVIKPKVKITFPWKLSIGENSWLGEEVWLLNLDHIDIGSNVCISQRALLCTGSHDWSRESFDLVTKPIIIEDGAWICANVFIGPGVTVGANAVVTAGSVVTKDLPANMVCSGSPCVPVKKR
jgi:putative colanic acid biosynthesis acetyltransferase WcaF